LGIVIGDEIEVTLLTVNEAKDRIELSLSALSTYDIACTDGTPDTRSPRSRPHRPPRPS
jgi:hypothetical protein